MNFNNILDKFTENIENNMCLYCEIKSQFEIFQILNGKETDFPMISFEKTDDSDFTVDVIDSKFLNDEIYDFNWIVISDDTDIIGLMCIGYYTDYIKIEVFEINKNYRNLGYAKQIIENFENSIENNKCDIRLVPYDTSAMSFWEHMGYNYLNINSDELFKNIY